MATIIKAFVELNSVLSNARGEVASIGELSDISKTFSREKQFFSSAVSTGVSLVVFYAQKGGTDISLTQAQADTLLSVAKDLEVNYDGSTTAKSYIEATNPTFTQVIAGDPLTYKGITIPENIEYVFDDAGESTRVQIWFQDTKFKADYDQYEVKIVPPIQPVMSLYSPYATVLPVMTAITPIVLSQQESVIRGDEPYTHRRVYELRWNDPSDKTKAVTTYWTSLGYGPDTYRVDIILEAIRKYLTDNSPYTITQWREYLPDILAVENFAFLPFWDKTALSVGGGTIHAIFSPVIKVKGQGNTAVKFLSNRTPDGIEEKAEVVPQVWNGLTSLVVPGLTNPEDKECFSVSYPDYALLAANDQNLSRLSLTTRTAIEAMERIAIVADDWKPGDTLSASLSLSQVGNAWFIEQIVNGMAIKYLTRYSYDALK